MQAIASFNLADEESGSWKKLGRLQPMFPMPMHKLCSLPPQERLHVWVEQLVG
jgi:hypothetical protein